MTNNLRPGERLDDLQLNGLQIIQDPERFCFGIDAVMLSDFAKVKPGEKVLDLGTGTGILPILLSAKTRGEHFIGLEIQKESADMARRSIEWNHLQEKIEIVQGDIKEAAALFKPTFFDVIVTNPPYVDEEDMSDLPGEYRHEPVLGLASGSDGLKLTRRILACAPDYLSDDGILICEVGNSMVHLMEQYPDVPFTWLEFENGGDGVFMLTKPQLIAARAHFGIYKD